MNDDFLYRLRVDPPADFAVRLKERLDARANASKRLVRWGVPFLIFGTAFALALPHLRNAFERIGSEAPVALEASVTAPKPVAAPSAPGASEGQTAPAAVAASETEARAPASAPSSRSNSFPAAAGDAVAADEAIRREAEETAARIGDDSLPEDLSNDAVPHSSTLADEARDAVVLRRSLFVVMNGAAEPLVAMARGRRPVDPQVVLVNARRIEQLAPLILEIFARDTRGFDLDTAARDEIWTRKESFVAEVRYLRLDAKILADATREGNPYVITNAIRGLMQTCVACHDGYRRNDRTRRLR